jgi:amidase
MARTVQDAVILLGALAGIDSDDKATSMSKGKSFTDYTQYLDKNGLSGARIGVVRKYFGFLPQVDTVINQALEVLKKQGAVLVDPANIDTIGKFDDSEFAVLLYELKADLNAYLSRPGFTPPVHSLKEIIAFNEQHADSEMPYFQQETFIKAEAKGSLQSKEYLDALKLNHRLARKEGIDAVMDKYKLDALVAPTDSPAWLTDLVDGDHFLGGSSTAAAVAGYPSITVPAGFIFGLPVGVSFFGRAWSEPTLIKIAYSFEQASKIRTKPKFLPTCQLK